MDHNQNYEGWRVDGKGRKQNCKGQSLSGGFTGDKFQCLMMLPFFTNRLEWFAWEQRCCQASEAGRLVLSVLCQFLVPFCTFPGLVGVGFFLMQFVFRQKYGTVVRSYYKARRPFLRLSLSVLIGMRTSFLTTVRVRSSFLSFLCSFYHGV